jgi:hypothetical protein
MRTSNRRRPLAAVLALFGCLTLVGCVEKSGLQTGSAGAGAGRLVGHGGASAGNGGATGSEGTGGATGTKGTGGTTSVGGSRASGGQSGLAGAGGTSAGGSTGTTSSGGKTTTSSTGGVAGTKGTGGTGAAPGTGGAGAAPGTGGASGVGGKGSGGTSDAGMDAGKPDAPTKDTRDGTAPIDTSPAGDAFLCGPVCAIYCPYGNVLDARGCPTCECNPAPADGGPDGIVICGPVCDIYCPYGNVLDEKGCPTCKCNPAPTDCPAIKCKACPYGYLLDASGCQTCDCAPSPLGCGENLDPTTCADRDSCRWLEPGCGTPPLPAAGCYEQASIGCTSDGDCTEGRTCLERVIDPCAQSTCNACGQTISLCL